MRKLKVLLVEDNYNEEKTFIKFFDNNKSDYTMHCVRSVGEALDATDNTVYDLLISDISYIDGNVFDLLKKTAGISPLIIITSKGCEGIAVKALKKGAFDYIIRDIEKFYINNLNSYIMRTVEEFRIEKMKSTLAPFFNTNKRNIFAFDFKGELIYMNPSAAETYKNNKADLFTQLSAEVKLRNIKKNDITEICLNREDNDIFFHLFYTEDNFILIEK